MHPDSGRGLMFARLIVLIGLLAAGCSGDSGSGQEPSADASMSDCKGLEDNEMVWVPGGTFTLGENPQYLEEGPPRDVEVEGFWMSRTEITNAQFTEFVDATGYVTEAERDPPDLEGAPPEMLQPGSAVFRVPSADDPSWWKWVPGAMWKQPSGPGSSIEGRVNDPVVQVTYADVVAYAEWAGVSLPSEAQWEYAARGGEPALPEPIGPDGEAMANYYQGVFPAKDLGEDGFTSRAPVGCFEANAFGLYDMIGNVWEWTASTGNDGLPTNLIKGGSFLCAANYCARYRPAARQSQETALGTDHIGFRVVDTQRAPPDNAPN